ncbi:glycosidase, PH1107-related [Thermosinus carboxydivorans Nor1]|uniref:Glycosidase, PH1107-related n=1 Tax=Thermosinus carboxydivorans Nor1 TaxID=401526 RepID=A1HSH3_9FIRM|nr:glycosidase [Thermosinus carboxydivorans]EAX47036.1 glycosidase, PH1107-related [Thermosinus carboxydivorans Nor1]
MSFQSKLRNHDNTYRELFKRHPDNPILTAHDWPYAANTVFNPAATMFNGKVLLLARVEDRRGFSHLTKAISEDGVTNWQIDPVPTFEPDPERYPEEIWGIEDPRITWIEELGKWAVTYTAYSRGGPLVSLALTKDFVNFERLGPIMPPDDKDAALFPRRFNGKWLLVHRPVSANYGPGAHIWVSWSDDLKYWGDHQMLINARRGGWWDSNKIGLSPPPLETPEGWLILYHGVRQTAAGAIYRLGLALLDLENPLHVLRRSDEWVFGPSEPYEREGDVDDVVFPCGWILDETTGQIKMYYGAADTCIALATASLSDLLEYIKRCPEPKEEDNLI